jgi:Domain of unknown function (DUF5668)
MNEINPTPPPPQSFPAPVAPPAPPPPVAYVLPGRPPIKSPALAGLLSALPGLGHVYLGLYQRAAIFFAVFALLQVLLDRSRHSGPGIPLFIAFWWFFVLIDAVRQAKAINATGQPEGNLVITEKSFKASGSLALGVFLMLFGVFFLIDRFVPIDLSLVLDWWPLLLIAFGGWQVFSYYKSRQAAAPKDGPTPF